MLKNIFISAVLGTCAVMSTAAWAEAPAEAPAEETKKELGPLELTSTSAARVIADINTNRALYESDSEALYGMVRELIGELFDFQTMSLLVLGPSWKKASDEQKTRFVDGFRNLLIRTYSKALLQAGDANVEWAPLDLAEGDTRTMVSGTVPTSSGPVTIHWRLRKTDIGWRVYDVVVDGISLVTNYRGTYTAEIRKVGLDGLIAKLEKNAG